MQRKDEASTTEPAPHDVTEPAPDDVVIHYTRLPDRMTTFRQRWVAREGTCTITLMEHTPLHTPVRAGRTILLEPEAPVVWFTFDGVWHDIGRFHTADGRFTGWYANVITPVEFTTPSEWATTDLFLDVWLGAGGNALILDEDEFEDAIAAAHIAPALATRARQEARQLHESAVRGDWPPSVARHWTLERARAAISARGTRNRGPV